MPVYYTRKLLFFKKQDNPEWARMYCNYYQARIKKEKVWQLTSVLRSLEHLVFDRTIDTKQSIFEFFVPQDVADDFLSVMHYFEDKGIVSHLQLLPNPSI